MKNVKLFLILAIVILIGTSGISAQTYAGGKSSFQGIEQKIFKKLITLPHYGVFDHIAYKLDGDTVTLYGKVAEPRNKRDAESALKRIDGVNRVVNNIEILPPSPFDGRIRRRVFRELARKGLFRYLQEPNPSVRLIVDGGRITLEGIVANRGDYNLMNILANGITDVFSVKNNLVVEKESR